MRSIVGRMTTSRQRAINDIAALNRFETFLTSAVATVLLVRLFLAATGYPQVGGGGLHVAHVLWGGLLMGIAIVMSVIGMGSRLRRRTAFVGGVGFGLFIDEIGKFLTKSVDYFFKPAVAIMYAVFVLFYLVVRVILQRRELTDARRLSLAATALADQALGQLDEARRQRTLELLGQVETETVAAAAIRAALQAQPVTAPVLESRLTRWRDRALAAAKGPLERRRVQRIIIVVFIFEALLVVIGAIYDVATDHVGSSSPRPSEIGGLISGFVAALIAMLGAWRLFRGERVRGLQTLQISVLVNVLVTDIFQFATLQFAALIGLFVQLIVLFGIRFALQVEQLREPANVPPPRTKPTGSAVSAGRS
jgi:hypothetical protein